MVDPESTVSGTLEMVDTGWEDGKPTGRRPEYESDGEIMHLRLYTKVDLSER